MLLSFPHLSLRKAWTPSRRAPKGLGSARLRSPRDGAPRRTASYGVGVRKGESNNDRKCLWMHWITALWADCLTSEGGMKSPLSAVLLPPSPPAHTHPAAKRDSASNTRKQGASLGSMPCPQQRNAPERPLPSCALLLSERDKAVQEGEAQLVLVVAPAQRTLVGKQSSVSDRVSQVPAYQRTNTPCHKKNTNLYLLCSALRIAAQHGETHLDGCSGSLGRTRFSPPVTPAPAPMPAPAPTPTPVSAPLRTARNDPVPAK